MNKLLVVIAMTLCFTATMQTTNCAASSYCQTCNTANGYCTACPGSTSFTKGAMNLSSNVCNVMTSANKPTVGSEHVDRYVGETRATASFTSTNYFFCKTGYYAYIDETSTTLTGCYASTTTSSAPLSNISG